MSEAFFFFSTIFFISLLFLYLYYLDGVWAFPSETDPGKLDLSVHSESGRVQELLEILGWQVPVVGRLYGDLRFYGPMDGIMAEGSVDVLEAVAWEQPLDRVTGSFLWDDGVVDVTGVQVRLGTGMAAVDGRFNLGTSITDVSFSASDWPLGFTNLFEERLGQVVGGMVDINRGRLSGTIQAPQVTGDIAAEALRVGPTLFRSVSGRLSYQDRRIEFTQLKGERAGGGDYTLVGSIEFPEVAEPVSDLKMQVTGERLRSLLQLANEELPAALIDGQVSGRIHVTGWVSNPEATLDLLLRETFALRRGIQVSMRYADGALRISELNLSDS